jgi:hypothetical protein
MLVAKRWSLHAGKRQSDLCLFAATMLVIGGLPVSDRHRNWPFRVISASPLG